MYRQTKNYENLQKCIFDGVGEYGIRTVPASEGTSFLRVGGKKFPLLFFQFLVLTNGYTWNIINVYPIKRKEMMHCQGGK